MSISIGHDDAIVGCAEDPVGVGDQAAAPRCEVRAGAVKYDERWIAPLIKIDPIVRVDGDVADAGDLYSGRHIAPRAFYPIALVTQSYDQLRPRHVRALDRVTTCSAVSARRRRPIGPGTSMSSGFLTVEDPRMIRVGSRTTSVGALRSPERTSMSRRADARPRSNSVVLSVVSGGS